jgi:predicted amidophosphoribosyltransferase
MAGNVAKAVLDLLFPPLCIGCRAPVGEAGFCALCWSGISFLDGPGCACCGLPFPVALEGENVCAACLARPPAFDSARAIFVYDQTSRGAVLALKHADRLELVPGFARWLSRIGRTVLEDSDLVVPVPLHPLRLWRRRYNQAAELARRGAVLRRHPEPQPPHPQPGRHGQRQGAPPQCAGRLQGARPCSGGGPARLAGG